MFLEEDSLFSFLVGQKRQPSVYSLQRRHNTAPRVTCARSRSWSRGCHPVAKGIRPLLLPVQTVTMGQVTLFLGGGRGQISRSSWKGERRRRREGLGLLRGGRVGSERIHCDV